MSSADPFDKLALYIMFIGGLLITAIGIYGFLVEPKSWILFFGALSGTFILGLSVARFFELRSNSVG